MEADKDFLVSRLNPSARRALALAARSAQGWGHRTLRLEHLLLVLLDDPEDDVPLLLRQYDVAPARLATALTQTLEALPRRGEGALSYCQDLLDCLSSAWLLASGGQGTDDIRSGQLLLAVVGRVAEWAAGPEWAALLAPLQADLPLLRRDLLLRLARPGESSPADTAADGVPADDILSRYTIDFTAQAAAGRIDPVFCRDREIGQMIDVLGRRRKNNPMCVGEPGVGKTAVVEGLALRITAGEVPDFLADVRLLGLDLGLLQAGAGMRGEFEKRLRAVIDAVKASLRPIILFIDEAHTLIGAGGPAGGGDAANLLKPALARGELRTIAATTWGEYKRYFEKDAALARRFELVKLDEPSPDDAVTILRGLRPVYEQAHGVIIRDEAVVAAARLSARYLSGRQLPDKAVDLLDTAAARARLSTVARPPSLEAAQNAAAVLRRERDALARDLVAAHPRLSALDDAIATADQEANALADRWQAERELVERLRLAAEPERAGLIGELHELRGDTILVHHEVTADLVGRVLSDWTGIPIGTMVRDEAAMVLGLEAALQRRVIGQDAALAAIARSIRTAKAGIGNPQAPLGVFLLVGPSGVGKTETATALADLLFGGERFMCTIAMSEFQEKHSVSRLIGSPPGYVGYGEGGVLTEAVRQRPYSVVLLDEVEKADLEVMNLFYQVFDKGTLSDGEGRTVDFRNTIILLTSNLATDLLTDIGQAIDEDGGAIPATEELADRIRPVLSRHFKPALLARMQIVPYLPLLGAPLTAIVKLKLAAVARRLRDSHAIDLAFAEGVDTAIARRCATVEAGARNIDHILNGSLLPKIAELVLSRLGGGLPDRIIVSIDESGGFSVSE
ncbi:type VI secretion system ATPase TssH [Niveispirillum sp. SYP-B3756]|uniref:type VI secretion system ATPase TssH n=1 Tax=Niveispirillum sp. SYP-B3756 TaxID=2662178 RepID=UPI0012909898|nr:type VI secretion system ATPase TssH [Niveispirillum sp. SYP-B3756]MQP64864.1 type VI secretion system ATPase TssH [Niveispirillum sp. SYP-B3756]